MGIQENYTSTCIYNRYQLRISIRVSLVVLVFTILSLLRMFHYNLEKSSIRNVYFVRACIDTILLSAAENFVFTGVRLKLPNIRHTKALLRQSIHSSFVNNKDIEVPQRTFESTISSCHRNLVVRILNNGPIDVWVKAQDIIAEVSLFPECDYEWKIESRNPDYRDLFLFGSLCERLRVLVIRKRKALEPIYRPEIKPETDELLDLLMDMDYRGAFNESYQAALCESPTLFDSTDLQILPCPSGITVNFYLSSHAHLHK